MTRQHTLAEMTAWRLRDLLHAGEVSAEQLLCEVYDEINRRESTIGAFISLRPREEVLAEAVAVDRSRRSGEPVGLLAGIPIAVKDNIAVKDTRLTCGSRLLENYLSPFDATVVERLRSAGLIIIGKTNLDEFGMGSSTEYSISGATRNPCDGDRVPGGSSGGSAAAVVANETILALGSDTGGSIRQPASLCGCVGLKPSYGRVSRFGLVAYASSLEQIGPVTKDVRDAALLLGLLAGHDRADSTSLNAPVPDYESRLDADDWRPVVIGVPGEYFENELDAEVGDCVRSAIDHFRSAGCKVANVSLPHTRYAIPAYYIIASSEASTNLARFDGVRYGRRAGHPKNVEDLMSAARSQGFGREVQTRIMLGTFALSAGYYDAYYLKAQKVRRRVADDFEQAFRVCDVLAHPASPTAAWPIGERIDDPLAMYLSDVYSVPANLAGLCGISVPCGRTASRLPVGIQLTGPHLQEHRLLQAAYALQQLLAESGSWIPANVA